MKWNKSILEQLFLMTPHELETDTEDGNFLD